MRLLILCLALLFLPACAEEKPAPKPSRWDEVLARVASRSADLKDMRASFEQKSLREGLSKPVVSNGTLLYRMDPQEGPVLLETVEKPEATVIRISRDRTEEYVPEDAHLAIHRIQAGDPAGRTLDAILLYGRPQAFWEEHYEISLAPKAAATDPDELVLVPKDEALRKTLLEIRMWVDPDTALPVRLGYRYARGEVITLALSGLKVNQGLKAADLTLSVPKGTVVDDPDREPSTP